MPRIRGDCFVPVCLKSGGREGEGWEGGGEGGRVGDGVRKSVLMSE